MKKNIQNNKISNKTKKETEKVYNSNYKTENKTENNIAEAQKDKDNLKNFAKQSHFSNLNYINSQLLINGTTSIKIKAMLLSLTDRLLNKEYDIFIEDFIFLLSRKSGNSNKNYGKNGSKNTELDLIDVREEFRVEVVETMVMWSNTEEFWNFINYLEINSENSEKNKIDQNSEKNKKEKIGKKTDKNTENKTENFFRNSEKIDQNLFFLKKSYKSILSFTKTLLLSFHHLPPSSNISNLISLYINLNDSKLKDMICELVMKQCLRDKTMFSILYKNISNQNLNSDFENKKFSKKIIPIVEHIFFVNNESTKQRVIKLFCLIEIYPKFIIDYVLQKDIKNKRKVFNVNFLACFVEFINSMVSSLTEIKNIVDTKKFEDDNFESISELISHEFISSLFDVQNVLLDNNSMNLLFKLLTFCFNSVALLGNRDKKNKNKNMEKNMESIKFIFCILFNNLDIFYHFSKNIQFCQFRKVFIFFLQNFHKDLKSDYIINPKQLSRVKILSEYFFVVPFWNLFIQFVETDNVEVFNEEDKIVTEDLNRKRIKKNIRIIL